MSGMSCFSASRTRACLASSAIVKPIGFWKLGIVRHASSRWRLARSASAARSMPVFGSVGTSTARMRMRSMAWRIR